MKEIEIYPFGLEAASNPVFKETRENFAGLINMYHSRKVRKENKIALIRICGEYFSFAEQLFDKADGANLFYHGRPHAIFQATYDAIAVARGILERHDGLSRHLSLEGSLAIVFGAMFHDSGYVTGFEGSCDNFAARTPVHVEAGMETVKKILDKRDFPGFVDLEKVKRLAIIGIHSTYFPFTEARKQEMRTLIYELPASEIKEAFIVGLSVRLADLGGQVARKDYLKALPLLKAEINATTPGLGNTVIGNDDEMATKCDGFIRVMVFPTVGKIANAFFGKENSFQKGWEKHLIK